MLGNLFPELQVEIFMLCDLSTRVSLRLTCSSFHQLLENKKRGDSFLAEQALLDGNYELFLLSQSWHQPLLPEYYLSAIKSNLPQAVSYLLAKNVPLGRSLLECVKNNREEIFHLLENEAVTENDIIYMNMVPDRPWLPPRFKKELSNRELSLRAHGVLASQNLHLVDRLFDYIQQEKFISYLTSHDQKELKEIKRHILPKLKIELLSCDRVIYFNDRTLFDQWVKVVGISTARKQFPCAVLNSKRCILEYGCRLLYDCDLSLRKKPFLKVMKLLDANNIPISRADGEAIVWCAITNFEYKQLRYIQSHHPEWLENELNGSDVWFNSERITRECLDFIHSLQPKIFTPESVLGNFEDSIFFEKNGLFLDWLDSQGIDYDINELLAGTFVCANQLDIYIKLNEKGYRFLAMDLLYLEEYDNLADFIYNLLANEEKEKVESVIESNLESISHKGLRWLVNKNLVSREAILLTRGPLISLSPTRADRCLNTKTGDITSLNQAQTTILEWLF